MVNLSVTQWAEVLSADAFSAFEDVGLDNDEVYFIFFFVGEVVPANMDWLYSFKNLPLCLIFKILYSSSLLMIE